MASCTQKSSPILVLRRVTPAVLADQQASHLRPDQRGSHLRMLSTPLLSMIPVRSPSLTTSSHGHSPAPAAPKSSTSWKLTTSARETSPAPNKGTSTNAHVSSPSVAAASSSDRSKRGHTADVFHEGTWIPLFDGSEKPVRPSRIGRPGSKLIHEEKVFFVHWLRWRLRQGPIPSKDTFFMELEREVQHLRLRVPHNDTHCFGPLSYRSAPRRHGNGTGWTIPKYPTLSTSPLINALTGKLR